MFVEHKEAVEVTDQPAKAKRLSDAIRIGAGLRPQCDGAPFFAGGSCAIGAAYEALGGDPDVVREDTGEAWAFVAEALGLEEVAYIYDEEGKRTELCEVIYTKNDCDKWTRERIADWLESQGY